MSVAAVSAQKIVLPQCLQTLAVLSAPEGAVFSVNIPNVVSCFPYIRSTRLLLNAGAPPSAESLRAHLALCKQHGVRVYAASVGFKFSKKPTSPMEAAEQFGLVPEATRAERLKQLLALTKLLDECKIPTINLHFGQIPSDRESSNYQALVKVVKVFCNYLDQRGMQLTLETGQESAEVMLGFIEAVGVNNLGANYDGANYLLYETSEPVRAFRVLAHKIRGVDFKDVSAEPNPTGFRGLVPLGTGVYPLRETLLELSQLRGTVPVLIESSMRNGDIGNQTEVIGHSLQSFAAALKGR